tara:strand:- start:85 stop:399 length:315 start_codon:yes stop_codon:yes gene_type:complete
MLVLVLLLLVLVLLLLLRRLAQWVELQPEMPEATRWCRQRKTSSCLRRCCCCCCALAFAPCTLRLLLREAEARSSWWQNVTSQGGQRGPRGRKRQNKKNWESAI